MTNLKSIFIHICIICIVAAGFIRCTSEEDEMSTIKPENFILLLDLSDRMLFPSVVENDQVVIHSVFEQFRSQVRMNLTFKSVDKLKVRIFPQRGAKVDVNRFENELSLDMTGVEVSSKNARLIQYENCLPGLVAQLYRESCLGRSMTSEFFGCDIWKYLNEQARIDLEKGYVNHIIVLTDGYFDFENSTHAMRMENRFTSSDFYSKLNGPDWQKAAEENDYGLIPVKLTTSFRCIVCGLNPKTDQLTELDKLSYFWNKWMVESYADTCILIPFSSSEKMKSELKKHFIKN